MKDSNFQRAMNYLKIHGLIEYNKDVATAVGVTEATISRAVKRGISADLAMSFNATYGNIFNIDWLLYGNGEMLAKEESTNNVNNSNVINGNNNSNISQTINTSSEEIEDADVIDESETAPIIPSVWVKRQDFDIMRMAEEHGDTLQHSRVTVKDTPLDAWYVMPDNSMSSYYLKGDKIGLSKQESKKIVPGCIYGIDTNTHGMLIRKLYDAEGGYRAHSFNSEEFPDFFIAYEETISVSRVIIQVRI